MKRAPNARWTRIFGLAGLLTLLRRVRRRADAKELAIESREQLFSMLVRNADGRVDVLADEAIRQGIKEYANWPTIPQLYIKGEFIGGSDIMREMYESGELRQMLAELA